MSSVQVTGKVEQMSYFRKVVKVRDFYVHYFYTFFGFYESSINTVQLTRDGFKYFFGGAEVREYMDLNP